MLKQQVLQPEERMSNLISCSLASESAKGISQAPNISLLSKSFKNFWKVLQSALCWEQYVTLIVGNSSDQRKRSEGN